jgi:hypothetical protein
MSCYRHGMKYTPEYMAWNQMKQRCLNVKHKAYPRYGGRGIKVCEQWMKFEKFLADVGMRPSKDHSLDRYPDKLGSYEPGNVRWATRLQQQNNMRSNRIVTYRGRWVTFAQSWRMSPRIVSQDTAWQRFEKSGWSIEDALETATQ